MVAARVVFARKQYLDTNVADIVREAGLAHGTFYRYFTCKEDIFREVALELQRDLLTGPSDTAEPPVRADDDPTMRLLARIERANRGYLEAYQRNAPLLGVLEQVSTFSDELRSIRRDVRLAFVERTRRSIQRMQADGLAYDDVDPHYAASALGAMVDRFAYVWLVLGEPFSLDEVCRTVTLLWARSLGLDVAPGTLGEPGEPHQPRQRTD